MSPDQSKPQPGDELPDGWVYLGVSPTTHKPISLEPRRLEPEEPYNRLRNWFETSARAKELAQDGNLDARLPTARELTYIFEESKIPLANFDLRLDSPHQADRCLWSSDDVDREPGYAKLYYLGQPGNSRAPRKGLDANIKNGQGLASRCIRTETFGMTG